MSTMTIRMTMEKIIDMPIIFVLVTVILFLVVVAVITAVGYTIACAQSKKTEMTGIMRVGVTLNDWYDASQYKDVSVLHYGDFWIGMKDPETVDGERLDAALNWKEKAFCRQYKVCLMLKRF